MVLGARLRELRLGASLTLEALSARAGVSARTIGNVERGAITAPQQHTLAALITGLKLDDDDRLELLRLAREARRSPSGDRATMLTLPEITDFVGRSEELSGLEQRLQQGSRGQRPVVISGPAGVGKTATALEGLRRVRGAAPKQLFVDLNGLSDAPLTPLQVLQSLLLQLSGSAHVPQTIDEALVVWRAAIRDEPVIVLLDDARDEAQVRPVLSFRATVHVVVTARRPLAGLEDVARIVLEPLPRDDSIRLLSVIVPQAQRETSGLAELAAHCGDLPLALRIAGNRISTHPALTVQAFVARQKQATAPLDAFVAGDLAVHSSLSLSYNQLDAAARSIFRSLSALDRATFASELVAAANGLDPSMTSDRMGDLVELGLVAEHGAGVYSLHVLVKHFSALQSRRAEDDVDGVRRRSRSWLLEIAASTPPVSSVTTARETDAPSLDDARRALEPVFTAADRKWIHDHLRGADLQTTGSSTPPATATRQQRGAVAHDDLVVEDGSPRAGASPAPTGSVAGGY